MSADAAIARVEAMLDRQLEPIRAELAAVRELLEPTPSASAGPRFRHPVHLRGNHSPEEAERIVAWLEAHRDEWGHLPYAGTVRGWIAGRSRPSRRLVAQLFVNRPDDPQAPGLGLGEPELEALLLEGGEAS